MALQIVVEPLPHSIAIAARQCTSVHKKKGTITKVISAEDIIKVSQIAYHTFIKSTIPLVSNLP